MRSAGRAADPALVERREIGRTPPYYPRWSFRPPETSTLATVLLYDSPVSGNCYKVRLLFAHLGLAYERRALSVVDRSDREQVLGALNPARRVPTLVLDDGRVLAESDAILWYFAEGTRYLPDERFERAKVLQWLFFEQYDHEPTLAVVRFWVAFAASPPPAA